MHRHFGPSCIAWGSPRLRRLPNGTMLWPSDRASRFKATVERYALQTGSNATEVASIRKIEWVNDEPK